MGRKGWIGGGGFSRTRKPPLDDGLSPNPMAGSVVTTGRIGRWEYIIGGYIHNELERVVYRYITLSYLCTKVSTLNSIIILLAEDR